MSRNYPLPSPHCCSKLGINRKTQTNQKLFSNLVWSITILGMLLKNTLPSICCLYYFILILVIVYSYICPR